MSVMDSVCLSVPISFFVPLFASDWFLPAKPCFLLVFLHHSLPLTGFPLLYFSLCHYPGVGCPQVAVPQGCPYLFGLTGTPSEVWLPTYDVTGVIDISVLKQKYL